MPYAPFKNHIDAKRAEADARSEAAFNAIPGMTEYEQELERNKTPEQIQAEMDDWIGSLDINEVHPRRRIAHPHLRIGDVLTFSSIAAYLVGKRGGQIAAAKDLNLTRGAVRAVITRLEEVLGHQLVDNGTALTPAGRNIALMGHIWSHWYTLVMETDVDQVTLHYTLLSEFQRISDTPEARAKIAQAATPKPRSDAPF